jgi:hypothetical protein
MNKEPNVTDHETTTKLRRSKTTTLCKLLHDLNTLCWPKLFGEPEDENEPGRPRRNAAMNEILIELGWRLYRATPTKRRK